MKIVICGGGSLAHVSAGVLAQQPECEVTILTRRPAQWQDKISAYAPDDKVYEGALHGITSHAAACVPQADVVFLCLPGFAIEECLRNLRPYLTAKTIVGTIVSSTGFFFLAHDILETTQPLFGFQRVPYIARTKEYGKSAYLLGYKKEVAIAVENMDNAETFRQTIEKLFVTPTRLLNNFYEAALTNSNPILHTGRLYSMWHEEERQTSDHNILFYKEWTDDASQTIVDMDEEFMQLLAVIGVDRRNVPSLLDYYEQPDVPSLTRKIQSIPAFAPILSPMQQKADGVWVPDWQSRYFTEDFPHGLRYIKELAEKNQVPTPTINKVYAWGMSKINNQNKK